ncbi:MAG: F0F1 ATP synthase subunit A, partial [Clostridia bacterium]|nr:F0F1 ATP synthase subunit A [Clostridia bacterium]
MIPINKRKIGVCILLSIITLGIYQIYWEYLLVKNTRAIKKDESSCTGEMLCLIFVPFYSLFWWFTRGKIVKDEFAKYGHSAIGNEIAYLILEIFGLGIISMSIMQNDFNSLSSDSTQSIQLSAILIPIIVVALLAALVVPVVIYTVSNEPVSDGSSESEEGGISLSVTGPKIFLSIDALKSRFGDILGNPITQTTVTLFLASVILITAAFFIGRSIKKRPGRGQVVVEKLVSMLYGLVSDTMGKHNVKFAPYIGTIFLSSLVCT